MNQNYKQEWVQTGEGQWFTERNGLWFCIVKMDSLYIVAVIEKQQHTEISNINRDRDGKRTLAEAKAAAESYACFQ